MMQASKVNESVSEYSKTGLCITVKVLQMWSRGNTQKSFKSDRGQIFQVENLNRISHGLDIQKSFTNQIRLHEMVV